MSKNIDSAPKRLARRWVVAGISIAALGIAWLGYSHGHSSAAAQATPAALPKVVVSKPLLRDVDSPLGFPGQFSAVDQVELRAQVGGALTKIHFKDGAIVHEGDLLFTIDSRPYEIRLAEATAQLETATARLALADRELERARSLQRDDAATVQNVDQRTADQRAARASVDDARAQIRDAQFDIQHCRIKAPFTGRIGTHLVSVGNLIAGSRAASAPTTLLATLVSLDPIHLEFDMSAADFMTFSRHREQFKGNLADGVEVALIDETRFTHQGRLDFVDNAIDQSSGTIHARATVPNPDMLLAPGAFARVRLLVAPPAPTLLVPDASVLLEQSEYLVLTVSPDGTVVAKHAEIGELRGGLRVILSGLVPDDRVVIRGLVYATPGSKVAVRDGVIHYRASADQD